MPLHSATKQPCFHLFARLPIYPLVFTSLTLYIFWYKQWSSHHRNGKGPHWQWVLRIDFLKKENSCQGNPQMPCFESQDSKSNHTCIYSFVGPPLWHPNLPKIKKMFVLSWESGDISISASRPLFLLPRQHLIKRRERPVFCAATALRGLCWGSPWGFLSNNCSRGSERSPNELP